MLHYQCYIFFFDNKVKNLWKPKPFLSLSKADYENYLNELMIYHYVRREVMHKYIKLIVKTIFMIILCILFIYLIHDIGVWTS